MLDFIIGLGLGMMLGFLFSGLMIISRDDED